MTLNQVEDYQFRVAFDSTPVDPITLDEPPPVGSHAGPSASRVLAGAVGHCLSSSLLFCLRKAKIQVKSLQTTVHGRFRRNENGRLRIGSLDVEIALSLDEGEQNRTKRCLEIFEDYCVVTGSVRKGIDVTVKVTDQQGNVLHKHL